MVGSTWPFQEQDIIIYCNGKKVYETSIANDGKALSDENYLIEWKDNIAVLSFHGEEQYDEIITLTFTDNDTSVVSRRETDPTS